MAASGSHAEVHLCTIECFCLLNTGGLHILKEEEEEEEEVTITETFTIPVTTRHFYSPKEVKNLLQKIADTQFSDKSGLVGSYYIFKFS